MSIAGFVLNCTYSMPCNKGDHAEIGGLAREIALWDV